MKFKAEPLDLLKVVIHQEDLGEDWAATAANHLSPPPPPHLSLQPFIPLSYCTSNHCPCDCILSTTQGSGLERASRSEIPRLATLSSTLARHDAEVLTKQTELKLFKRGKTCTIRAAPISCREKTHLNDLEKRFERSRRTSTPFSLLDNHGYLTASGPISLSSLFVYMFSSVPPPTLQSSAGLPLTAKQNSHRASTARMRSVLLGLLWVRDGEEEEEEFAIRWLHRGPQRAPTLGPPSSEDSAPAPSRG
ncbi:hypothetical protein FQN60_007514, partial [Etheostoma spectabile]